ncbi:MAG TPA: alpha/beta hydrolase [Burkholderiales bacterium]|nr:alpha/beta hydrolase [Burkholderiales bacterium]
MLSRIRAGALEVAYEESGPRGGTPVLLLHGFPYDIHAFDEVAASLATSGCRVIVPYVRGYGPTRFLYPNTPRSGQQAVLAHDVIALMDALSIESAVLAGFDWGSRSACIVAALWPKRVRGLVCGAGYIIQDIAASLKPAPPEDERRLWYQYYFHSERGRAGLQQHRHAMGKLLWRLWSPSWHFADLTYDQTARSFENPDFVAVAVHSYRHRYGLAPGDPAAEDTERRLAALPSINVPAVALHGADDGVTPPAAPEKHARFFRGPYERHVLAGIGHNLPQEAPEEFTAAVLFLAKP